MRLTWLADAFRAHGLKVVEVSGWKSRGSDDFDPVGVTWHATAGSKHATAQGEVNVILNGSNTAPPPIAQIMLWRDGTLYICAAGRCNHNKVGWGGPNRGMGNRQLLGIEMANDNRGEPWPPAQLDAARKATAIIMKRLGADPMKRLAAHYEHQPYVGRPVGETSVKSDPYGVVMVQERPKVRAVLATLTPKPDSGDDIVATVDEVWAKEFKEYVDEDGDGTRETRTVADILFSIHRAVITAAQREATLLSEVGGLKTEVANLRQEVADLRAGSSIPDVP